MYADSLLRQFWHLASKLIYESFKNVPKNAGSLMPNSRCLCSVLFSSLIVRNKKQTSSRLCGSVKWTHQLYVRAHSSPDITDTHGCIYISIFSWMHSVFSPEWQPQSLGADQALIHNTQALPVWQPWCFLCVACLDSNEKIIHCRYFIFFGGELGVSADLFPFVLKMDTIRNINSVLFPYILICYFVIPNCAKLMTFLKILHISTLLQ